MNAHHQSDPHQRARLRWRARRGLLENDLIMTRFWIVMKAELTDDQVGALSELLDWSDNDLMDLILARKELAPEQASISLNKLVEMLRAA